MHHELRILYRGEDARMLRYCPCGWESVNPFGDAPLEHFEATGRAFGEVVGE